MKKIAENHGLLSALLIGALSLSFTGCRDDCENAPQDPGVSQNGFRLDVEWELEWEYGDHNDWFNNWDNVGTDNDYDYFRPRNPEGIAVVLYEGDSNNMLYNREVHLPATGGGVSIDESTSGILVFSDDSDYILLNSLISPHSAYASTRTSARNTRSALDDFHGEERMMNAPDVLYSAYLDLSDEYISKDGANKITLKPLVYGYVVKFYIVKNQEYIVQARGAFAGMAETIFLKDGKTSKNKATIPFDCELTSYGVGAQIVTFGVPDDHELGNNRYDINLELLFKNGKTYSMDFDITDQLEKQPTGGVIFLNDIEIPDALVKSGSGFDTEVENWGDQNDIDLPLKPKN